jgi:hypothetical protein
MCSSFSAQLRTAVRAFASQSSSMTSRLRQSTGITVGAIWIYGRNVGAVLTANILGTPIPRLASFKQNLS